MPASEPKFAGQPITLATHVVLAVHLLLCCAVLVFLVPGTPLNLEGVLVSPVLQWFYGTFTLFNIPVIVSAGVGLIYVVETHLDVYAYVLLISVVIDAIYFLVFLIYGQGCTTKTLGAQRNHFIATMSCGAHDGFTLFCLTLLVLFKGVGLLIVSKAKSYVCSVHYHNFVPYMQKHLASLDYPQPKEDEDDVADPMPTMDADVPTMPPSWGTQIWRSMPATVTNAIPTILPSMRSQATAFPKQAYPSVGTLMPSMGQTVTTGYNSAQAAPTSIRSAAVPSTII